MKKTILLLLVIFVFIYPNTGIGKSNDEASDNSGIDLSNQSQEKTGKASSEISFVFEPLDKTYYENILNSKELFSKIVLTYGKTFDSKHPYERKFGFCLESKNEDTIERYVNKKFSEISSYFSFYYDSEKWGKQYECDIPVDLISPVFAFIKEKPDYYFNTHEYHQKKEIPKEKQWSFGYINHITLTIQQPDRKPGHPCHAKTFCKGWNSDEKPPEELKPLIDYLETVIIPYIKEHNTLQDDLYAM